MLEVTSVFLDYCLGWVLEGQGTLSLSLLPGPRCDTKLQGNLFVPGLWLVRGSWFVGLLPLGNF